MRKIFLLIMMSILLYGQGSVKYLRGRWHAFWMKIDTLYTDYGNISVNFLSLDSIHVKYQIKSDSVSHLGKRATVDTAEIHNYVLFGNDLGTNPYPFYAKTHFTLLVKDTSIFNTYRQNVFYIRYTLNLDTTYLHKHVQPFRTRLYVYVYSPDSLKNAYSNRFTYLGAAEIDAYSGGSGYVDDLTNLVMDWYVWGGGNIKKGTGIFIRPRISGDSVWAFYHMSLLRPDVFGGGFLDTVYGIYMDEFNNANINWQIYLKGGRSELGDRIFVDTVSNSSTLFFTADTIKSTNGELTYIPNKALYLTMMDTGAADGEVNIGYAYGSPAKTVTMKLNSTGIELTGDTIKLKGAFSATRWNNYVYFEFMPVPRLSIDHGHHAILFNGFSGALSDSIVIDSVIILAMRSGGADAYIDSVFIIRGYTKSRYEDIVVWKDPTDKTLPPGYAPVKYYNVNATVSSDWRCGFGIGASGTSGAVSIGSIKLYCHYKP